MEGTKAKYHQNSPQISVMKNLQHEFVKYKYLYLMILLPFLWFIIFKYIPMYGLVISFKRYSLFKGISGSPWIGFKYYKQIFTDTYTLKLLKNNLLLGLYSVLSGFPAPIILAIMFNEIKIVKYKRITQTISYLPHFISTVLIVGILNELFNMDGIFNSALYKIFGDKTDFLGSSKWFRALYIGSDIWQQCGWGAIIYLAALSGVDVSLYEAAYIDGCGRWKKIWHIDLPSILPTIQILFILRLGSILGASFEKVYLMQNPGNTVVSEILQTAVYKRGIINGEFSYSTALGLLTNVVSFVFLITANLISRKANGNSLW